MPGNPPGLLPPPPPGAPLPSLPFPPVSMMPNGPMPVPQMMNFGLPSLAPLVPPPTLLVPYPVIVPLPVPIPIPIPIPHVNDSKPPNGFSSNGENFIPSAPGDSSAAGGKPGGHSLSPRDSKQGSSKSADSPPGCSGQALSLAPAPAEHCRSEVVDLTRRAGSPPGAGGQHGFPGVLQGPQDGVIDLTVGHRARLHNVIHRALHAQVKAEREPGAAERRTCGGCRDGHCSPPAAGDPGPGAPAGPEAAAACNVIVNGTRGAAAEGAKGGEPPPEQPPPPPPPPPAPRSRRRLRPRLPRTAPASPRGAGRPGGGAPWRPRGWPETDPRGHPDPVSAPPRGLGSRTPTFSRDPDPGRGTRQGPGPKKPPDPDLDRSSDPRLHKRPWPGPQTGVSERNPRDLGLRAWL